MATMRSTALVEAGWLDRLCSLLPARGAILDIGCGSGLPIAGSRALRIRRDGVDAAATMLALFGQNLPDMTTHRCDMRALALGRRFAGLLAWDSFFHLSPDEQRGMFPRFAAHANPHAALMVTSGNAEGSAIGVLESEPLYHGSLIRRSIASCWTRTVSVSSRI